MSSLVFLGTYVTRVEIPLFGSKTIFHLGNMFCLVASILFGPITGGLAGAIGMSFFDIISGSFIAYFPFTFILKFFVGFICGKIKQKNKHNLDDVKINFISISIALLVNIIFSPIISLFIKTVIYGLDFYVSGIATIGSVVSVIVNAVLSCFLALFILKFLEPKKFL